MVKKAIRKEYNAKRLGLSAQQIEEKTAMMLENFRKIDLQGVQVVLSYYPITERAEFNVTLCEQLLLLNNPLVKIAWPRIGDDKITMEAVPVDEEKTLIKNNFNIPEPSGSEITAPQLIDAVFVPLLAFDTKGYRVGYGKGFYDRYLARCAQDVVKIGFSFFEALEAIDDINEFDVPLNYCITPLRVYEF